MKIKIVICLASGQCDSSYGWTIKKIKKNDKHLHLH